MQITEHTPQAELERLYTAVTQREMLRSTPLNLRMFLRYALLFILFPGMVGGFRVGLGLTLVFCALLSGLVIGGMQEWSLLAVKAWLTAGVCILLWVSCGTVRSALALRRTRRTPRPADAAYTPAAGAPTEQKLRWRRAEGGAVWEAELEYSQQQAGICALLLQVQSAKRGRLLTPERRGVCMVQSAAQSGDMQSLLLYKLEPGCHRLRWIFAPEGGSAPAPQGKICWLTRPTKADA